MRILVVDDVGYVRHYFDRLLTQHGHLVWTAASGFQALEILKNEISIQVVITDLLMPGMDGLELFRAAQKLDRRNDSGALIPRLVFYLITALRPSSAKSHSDTNLLQQALQLGFAEVLLKPIDNEHLLRQLALLEKKLVPSQPAASPVAATNHAELLHVIDQNIERLLCNSDGASLAELTELLQSSLDRIRAIMRRPSALPLAQSSNFKHTLHDVNAQSEPNFSASGTAAGAHAAGSSLVAENGLSMEKQL